ncbi:glycerophosphocholine phosphodiesterase GPCPD1 [Pancytospora philotis]|nr:glycerophosphocholine phosphodiesterase GPCPD1 [Pancytospora philotis]
MHEKRTFNCLLVIDRLPLDETPSVSVNNTVPAKYISGFGSLYAIFEVRGAGPAAAPRTALNIAFDPAEIVECGFIFQEIATPALGGHVYICDPLGAAVAPFDAAVKKIGHRGCGTNEKHYVNGFIENTIGSFMEARRLGAHAVELDVHLTTDEQLVVYHNDRIDGMLVRDMTHAQFLEKIAHIIEQDSRNGTYADIMASLPCDLGVNVELKNASDEILLANSDDYLARLANATLEQVVRSAARKVLFSSFSPLLCLYVKLRSPDAKVSLLLCRPPAGLQLDTDALGSMVLELVEYSGLAGLVIDTEYVGAAHSLVMRLIGVRKEVLCYGNMTNTPDDAKVLYETGCHALITDNLPGLQHLP